MDERKAVTTLPSGLALRLESQRAELAEMCDAVRSLPIASQEALDELGSGAKTAKGLKEGLDAERKELIKDSDAYVRSVNALFREPIRACEALEKAIKDRIARHAREQAEAARALQEKAGALFQAGQAQAAQTALAAVPTPQKAAGVSIRERWTAEITDPSLLPREYWVPSLDRVIEAVRATNGAPIPGVRVFKEQIVGVKR